MVGTARIMVYTALVHCAWGQTAQPAQVATTHPELRPEPRPQVALPTAEHHRRQPTPARTWSRQAGLISQS